MPHLAAQIDAAAKCIQQHWDCSPCVGIILGTGLGNFAEHMVTEAEIPYRSIPHFPAATALSHRGQFVCGRIGSVPVMTMQGRLHLYEGYDGRTATLPVRVMQSLGAELLIVSNASGGLNPRFGSGDIMAIADHINLMWQHPLTRMRAHERDTQWPNLRQAYDPVLIEQATTIAAEAGFPCHQGVYASMSGPTYETRAEYRMLRKFGADVVGMSTVPETIVALDAGMKVLGLSAVTNLCRPDTLESTDGHAVAAAAERAEPRLRLIINSIVARFE